MYNPSDIFVMENKLSNINNDKEIQLRQCIEKLTGIIVAVTCKISEEDGRDVVREVYKVLEEAGL